MADGDASSNPSKGCKIFVGNISFVAEDQELDEVFSEFGQIVEAAIIKDRDTGRSRGYGFVTYEDSESAQNAIEKMHQKEVFGRALNVKTADTKNTKSTIGARMVRSNRGGRNGWYENQNNGYNGGYGGGFGQYYDQGGYDDYYPGGGYGRGGGYGPGPMSMFKFLYVHNILIL